MNEIDKLTAPAASTNGNRRLNVEDVLSADDVQYSVVQVPEWGGCVAVRSMNAKEAELFGETPKNDGLVRLVEICAVNADGSKMFTSPEQVEALRVKNWAVILRVHQAAAKLNGITNEAVAAAKNA